MPPAKSLPPSKQTRSRVVKQRAAHADDDIEESREKKRTVQNRGELRLIVHRALRGGSVKGHGEAETAHAEHLRELGDVLGPEEGSIEVQFVGQASVNDIEDDGGEESDQAANRHKRHGAEVAEEGERCNDRQVDDAPEDLALSERELPLDPGEARQQVVEHNLRLNGGERDDLIRNQTATDQRDKIAEIQKDYTELSHGLWVRITVHGTPVPS